MSGAGYLETDWTTLDFEPPPRSPFTPVDPPKKRRGRPPKVRPANDDADNA